MTSAKISESAQNDVWQFHLRKAKGELLTNEEAEQLAGWYAQQEQQERAILQLGSTSERVEPLQSQIDTMLTQIAAKTAQIQQLAAENRQLCQEIVRLEDRLTEVTTLQLV